MNRLLVCFRTSGGIGRHPVENDADVPSIVALLERLARLVGPAEWWCERETPRNAIPVMESET